MLNSKLKIQNPKLFIFFSFFFAFTLSAIWLNSHSASHFRTDLKQLILNELIYINPSPFGAKADTIYVLGGTFSEAKAISSLLKSRGYKDIVLISSDSHTKRIKISFNNFLKDQDIKTYTQGSGQRVLLRHAIFEFIKLKVYQYFLI